MPDAVVRYGGPIRHSQLSRNSIVIVLPSVISFIQRPNDTVDFGLTIDCDLQYAILNAALPYFLSYHFQKAIRYREPLNLRA